MNVVLAHGAGSGPEAPHLVQVARALEAEGHRVLRFAFPYRAEGRKVPDRMPRLVQSFREAISSLGEGPVVLGGHSMGGRVATMLEAETPTAAGLLLLSYPLHPPKKPEQLRSAHLPAIRCPVLWLRGPRDEFATVKVSLDPNWRIAEIAGADHSFQVRKKDGRTREEVLEEVAKEACRFVGQIAP